MLEKIKEFFKRFWWVFLVPIAVTILHAFFRKATPGLDRLIKEKQKEIKENKKDIEKNEQTKEEAKESLENAIESSKATLGGIAGDSAERDKKAEDFFI